MSKSEMKIKDFYVEFNGDPSKDTENRKRYCAGEKFEPLAFSDEVVHFIEHSHYLVALELIERLENTLVCIDIDYEEYWGMAREALADIEKFREGL